jgi:hypothetical protein
MMFEVVNHTRFLDALIPGLDRDDVAHLTVLLKGTFRIPVRGGAAAWAENQVPIRHADETTTGEPASSVRHESDLCPAKPGTDVVLLGHAYAGARARPTVDVSLQVGPLRKVARVTGDRIWTRAGGAWIPSRPVPFERLPLVYERAFGGADVADPDPARRAADERNPAGTGFVLVADKDRLRGLRLPNLEDPAQPIAHWRDRPPIAGFGWVSRAWLPRRRFAGTFDAAWARERAPLLPFDFDQRFFNGAPADQVVTPQLVGGEVVRLENASARGPVAFELPRVTLRIEVQIDATAEARMPKLDTVVIEPDLERVTLCWRDTLRCGRRLRQVRRVVVREERDGVVDQGAREA